MNKSKIFSLIAIFLLLLTSCSSNTETTTDTTKNGKGDSKAETVNWAIGTSSSNSAPYAIGGAISKTLNDHQTAAKLSPQVTAGFMENVPLVSQKEIDLGLNEVTILKDAYNGEGNFKGQDFSNLRVLFNVAFYPTHIVVLEDSGINDTQDLKGKKFSIAQPSQSTRLLALAYLKANGLTVDDIDAQELSTSEALTALKNKQIDGAVISSPLPMGGMIELATTHKIKLLPIEGEAAEKFNVEFGGVLAKSVIPANTYPGVDYDVPSLAAASQIFTHKDTDETIIYGITKAFFDNIEDYYQNYPGGKTLNLDNALEVINDIPLHPGAEKYFKEKGKK